MIDIAAVFAEYNGAAFPDFAGKNATGAGATDGTEFIAAMIDNWMWGWSQALLNYCGLTPDGVTESDSASQILDALNMVGVPVGSVIEWNRVNDPATDGLRYLLLNGQGILRANYTDLDSAVYVGDGNNAAVAAAGGGYYHADDAAGATPNTAGVYLILPESRGYAPRGLDLAASIDPQGASRYLGDNQLDAFQGHRLNVWGESLSEPLYLTGSSGSPSNSIYQSGTFSSGTQALADGFLTDGVNGTPRISSESRMTNRSTKYAIRY